MDTRPRVILVTASALVAAALLPACASTSESAGSQSLAANVGLYSPPPAGISVPRVGIPPLEVGSSASAGMENIAADQLATLLVRTDRFDVIERSQLQKLMDEQNLEGVVEGGELAGVAQVRGVDYLMLGKVTNLRVKQARTGSRSGFGNVVNIALDNVRGGIGGLDIDQSKIEVKVECGVDLRLVDPSTGSLLDASFSEYTRTDTAKSMGIQVLGIGAESEADLQISDDDRGLVLRLALDDAVRKMLPSLDRKLVRRARDMEDAGTE